MCCFLYPYKTDSGDAFRINFFDEFNIFFYPSDAGL